MNLPGQTILWDHRGEPLVVEAETAVAEPATEPGISAGLNATEHVLRADGLTERQSRFLMIYRNRGSVLYAARACKIGRTCHYNWLRESEAYRAAFAQAQEVAASILEDEAHKRATEGVLEPVFYKGKVVGYKPIYSDFLLAKLLSARNPKVFRESTKLLHSNSEGNDLTGINALDALLATAEREREEARQELER